MCRISFHGKIFEIKCALQNASNLFGSDWIVLFDLWQLPINSFCNRVDVFSKSKNKQTEKVIEDVKNSFPHVFSESVKPKWNSNWKKM